MGNIDRRAIKELGIPGPVLMENAAAAVLTKMERFFDGLAGVKVGVICGKGNTGGDGLALARRLRIRGVPVRVALLAPFAALGGEAKINLAILRKTDVEILQALAVIQSVGAEYTIATMPTRPAERSLSMTKLIEKGLEAAYRQ